jgi:hypothetical protein
MTRFNDSCSARPDLQRIECSADRLRQEADLCRRPEIIQIKCENGVSPQFKEKVNSWINTIPFRLQKQMAEHNIKIQISPTSASISEYLRDGHFRVERANNRAPVESVYIAGHKRLYFIEHPDKTPEQHQILAKVDEAEKDLAAHGVQDLVLADIRDHYCAPFAPVAWHELGHAFDLAVLNSYSLSSQRFYDAFNDGRKSMTAAEKSYFDYFIRERPAAYRGHETDTAQQELFAQLFALQFMPKAQRARAGGERFQEIFTHAVDVIRDENPTIFGYEGKGHHNSWRK